MATYFPMQNGRIKIQVETLLGQNPTGASAGWIWQATGEGNNAGSQGTGYYYFKSETLDGSVKTPTQGVFSATIEVPTDGYYTVRLRTARDTNDPGDSRNDIWMKIDNNIRDHLPEGTVPVSVTGGFVKLKGANTSWTYANKLSATNDDDANPTSLVWLEAGSHTITFAGRSVGYHIDFFEVIRQGLQVPLTAPDTAIVTDPDPAPVAHAPVAADDHASTLAGSPVAIDVLANDTDADGDRVGYRGFVGVTAEGGTVERVGMNLVYTPPAGFTGTDSFTYVALDATGLDSNRATVTIEVRDPGVSQPLTVSIHDAATDRAVATLADGASFDAASLAADSTFAVAIDEAGALAGKVGSVKLTLSGDASATRIETGAPYALFGDKDGDLNGGGLDLGPGSYHFEVEVFSGAKGKGTLLDSFDFDFTVKEAAEPLSVGVYDSTTDTLVATLADGAVLDAAAVDGPTTFAVAIDEAGALAGRVGSVKLTLSGDASATRIETGAPYALFGDKDGDLKDGIALGEGSYHFEVEVFAGAKGTGRLLDTMEYDFTVGEGELLLV
jgi:hypothetical protein